MDVVTIRAGSQNAVEFTFKKDEVGIDLSDFTEIELRLKSLMNSDIKSFTMTDGTIIRMAGLGVIEWRPKNDSFAQAEKFLGYFILTDAGGKNYNIPDEENFTVVVLGAFVE